MRRVGETLGEFSRKWVPDAFVFAILLTLVVYVAALAFTDHGPIQLIQDWYAGFWGLLEFAMQMTLVLVTGYALASSSLVRAGLARLAALPRSGTAAVAITAVAAAILGWVHWGLGLMAGALLAREIATVAKDRGIKVHYPLVAAAGYVGLLIWHSGLSGSAPLLVNTEGHFLEEQIGIVSLGQTLFRPFNLVIVVAILVIAPVLLASMHPREEAVVEIDDGGGGGSRGGAGTGSSRQATETEVAPTETRERLPAERLAHSRALVAVIVAGALIFLVPFFVEAGVVGLDLNVVNFTFLMLGLAAHGTLAAYARAVMEGAKAASGVIVQFPFYAGIMGIMDASGLISVIAGGFIAISTSQTYPFWAMVSAALVNFAVPSGGGQWAVQGPIVVEASQALGVDVGKGVMAVAVGDQLTNMIQPFWALPLLGVTGLKAGEVLGYTAVLMLVIFVVAALSITFLA